MKKYFIKPPFRLLTTYDVVNPIPGFTLPDDAEGDVSAIEDFIRTYPDVWQLRIDLALAWNEKGNEEAETEVLEKALKDFPTNRAIKYYRAFLYVRNQDWNAFSDLLKEEISALENDTHIDDDLEINGLFSLEKMLADYFMQTGQTALAHKVFQWQLSLGEDSILTEIAFIIRDKEFVPSVDPAFNMELAEWFDKIKILLEPETINHRPYHDVFIDLVPLRLELMDNETIRKIEAIDDKEEILHDLKWLLNEGLELTTYTDLNIGNSFLSHALYIAASKDIEAFLPVFMNVLSVSSESITEELYSDYMTELLGPSIMRLLIGRYKAVLPYLENKEISWYHRLTFMEILTTIAYVDPGEKENIFPIIDHLIETYLKNNDEMINWVVDTLAKNHFAEYKEKIAEIIGNNILDEEIISSSELVEEMMDDHYEESYSLDINSLEEYYKDADAVLDEFNSFLAPRNLEDLIDKVIYEYEADRSDSIVDLDNIFLNLEEEREPIIRQLNPDFSSHNSSITSIKVGRNEPCPCGSGKKYKKCCLNKIIKI